jgi:hypothetical protein
MGSHCSNNSNSSAQRSRSAKIFNFPQKQFLQKKVDTRYLISVESCFMLPKKPGLFFITIVLFVTATCDHHDKHSHDHAGGLSSADKMEKPARKFAADLNLQKGMTQIHDIIKALHNSKGEKDLPSEAAKLEAAVQNIFQTCKLEPEPDKALHGVLAGVLEGAAIFKKGDFDAGHEKIHSALMRYEEFFEHPGWRH